MFMIICLTCRPYRLVTIKHWTQPNKNVAVNCRHIKLRILCLNAKTFKTVINRTLFWEIIPGKKTNIPQALNVQFICYKISGPRDFMADALTLENVGTFDCPRQKSSNPAHRR